MIQIQYPEYKFRLKAENGRQYIFDSIRKRYVVLTPEEWVRQHVIRYLTETLNYPARLFSVEKVIKVGNLKKRYDIVVYDQELKPWMLVECKEAGINISDTTLQQLLRYYQVLQCPYWMLVNGANAYCATIKGGKVSWMDTLPPFI